MDLLQIEAAKQILATMPEVDQALMRQQRLDRLQTEVNEPPAKAGGFGLRLKAGLIGHAADSCSLYTTLKSSSGSGGF
jgi:hypothetical protein